ncbi:MAG: transcription activator effector binding [Hyphomicrobiales bacterium]|nr:transcription activator effector binding [Hyphomicrobiales bacterium]
MRDSAFARLARTTALIAIVTCGMPALAQTTPGSGAAGSTGPSAPAPAAPAPAVPGAAAEPQVIPAPDLGRSTGDASTAQQTDLAARPALIISGSAQWDEGFAKIMAAFADIRTSMGKAGLQPGGKPIAVFTDTDDDGFKFQAMIPLTGAPAAGLSLAGTAKLGDTPAGKAMKFEHRSAYDDIDSTYEAITAYLDEKGIEAKPTFIEEYLTEPKTADDTSLQVDVYVFMK